MSRNPLDKCRKSLSIEEEIFVAEYGIYEVHYDEDHSSIEEVHAKLIQDSKASGEYALSKDEVVNKIENNYKVVTLLKKDDGSGNWIIGAEVLVSVIDGQKYIKTEPNDKKEDNLGELPEY